MPTVILDPLPVEIDELLDRRRRLGLDHADEVWEGVLHVNPGPHGRHGLVLQQLAELFGGLARAAGLVPVLTDINVGAEGDYRVPDGGILYPGPARLYYPTAALVVEILSPKDESWAKLPFYAAHDVDEVLIVDPKKREIYWLGLQGDRYEPIERSGLIELGPKELAGQIAWS
ncbi:MAG TPA: Uma2 family endonuclease [Solirubrobacteraceae bacterium]|jgi:Uma2 family endonuclease|nr:Uma2 family endonuclease [Solirubrobacteraceae bacterium]